MGEKDPAGSLPAVPKQRTWGPEQNKACDSALKGSTPGPFIKAAASVTSPSGLPSRLLCAQLGQLLSKESSA